VSETTDGPGTAAYRLRWLLDELERRYPNPEPFRSDIGPEEHYIRAIDAARARHIREAVEGLGRGTQSEGDDIVEIGNTGVWVSRAALLDALGGTTPPLDETGGKA